MEVGVAAWKEVGLGGYHGLPSDLPGGLDCVGGGDQQYCPWDVLGQLE